MATMHSLDFDFMNEISVLANTELLKCDTDFNEEKIATLAPAMHLPPSHLLSEEKIHCLSMTAKAIINSGLTNGYEVTLNEVKGVLYWRPMISIIFQNVPSSIAGRNPFGGYTINFLNDLADNAGHHVLMFPDAYGDDNYLEYFNSKLPEYFTYEIRASELYLLACFFAFGSNYLEHQNYY
jgi:hypothetical protein